MSREYQVVFEYVDGPSVGGRFRCNYKSKEDLEKSLLDDCLGNKVTKVIAEGVSDEEGLRLCEERIDIAKANMQREFMEVFNCYVDEQLDTFKQMLEAVKSSPEDVPSVMEKILEECGIE